MKKLFLLAMLALICVNGFAAKKIDRGLGNPKSVYIGKGTFSVGAAAGYNRFDANGRSLTTGASLVGLVTNINGNAALFNVSASGFWCFKDNLSLGLRLGYNSVSADINNLQVLSTMSFANQHLVNRLFTGAVAMRAYIPLFNSKVVALFGEARITGGVGYGKDYAETDRGKEGTYSDLYSVSLGIYPGISVFLTNFLSVELSLPLLEGGYEWNNQIEGQVNQSNLSHGFFNYKPSLLGLNLGIIFHF